MHLFFYTISIYCYLELIRIAALFNTKAKLWVNGRKQWKRKLQEATKGQENIIWFHAASLGEFEQGRPLMERLKKKNPNNFILLSFFSPSGYEIKKDYQGADYICYLPIDSPSNARFFVETIKAKQVFFIKYEFWFNFLNELQKNKTPHFLVSGIFRPNQMFFKWYGKRFLAILQNFNHLFVQNEASQKLLKKYKIQNHSLTGDTRFDRVLEIAQKSKTVPLVESFTKDKETLVVGSSWPQDEEMLKNYINDNLTSDKRYIIAPHNIDEKHLQEIENLFTNISIRFSTAEKNISLLENKKILIIDNIGILSSLYKYGTIAYIGGGLKTGLHNILEAAVYGIPVVFGNNYSKFQEAKDLVQLNGAFNFSKEVELKTILNKLFSDKSFCEKTGDINRTYIEKNKGAVEKIISITQKN